MPCNVSYNPCYSHCNATTTPLQPYYKPCNNHCSPHRVTTIVTTVVILLGALSDTQHLLFTLSFCLVFFAFFAFVTFGNEVCSAPGSHVFRVL